MTSLADFRMSTPSFTDQVFIQRGQTAFAVQWTGEMTVNLVDFLATRGVDEYWISEIHDLIIRSGIHYKMIPPDTWLIDQSGLPSWVPFQFVECNDERFHLLYREKTTRPNKEATI